VNIAEGQQVCPRCGSVTDSLHTLEDCVTAMAVRLKTLEEVVGTKPLQGSPPYCTPIPLPFFPTLPVPAFPFPPAPDRTPRSHLHAQSPNPFAIPYPGQRQICATCGADWTGQTSHICMTGNRIEIVKE
jgi:hypothetical protein